MSVIPVVLSGYMILRQLVHRGTGLTVHLRLMHTSRLAVTRVLALLSSVRAIGDSQIVPFKVGSPPVGSFSYIECFQGHSSWSRSGFTCVGLGRNGRFVMSTFLPKARAAEWFLADFSSFAIAMTLIHLGGNVRG